MMDTPVAQIIAPQTPPAPDGDGLLCKTPGLGKACDVVEVVEAVKNPAESVVTGLAQLMTESSFGMIEELSSFWLAGDSTATFSLSSVESVQASLTAITYPVLVIGTLIAICRAYLAKNQGELVAVGGGFGRILLVGVAGPIILQLMKGVDVYSVWLVNDAQEADYSTASLVNGTALAAAPPFLQLVLSMVALFSSLAQYTMLLIRPVFVMLLMAVWPITAAMTSSGITEPWERVTRWLFAWLSYKLVAAVALALGSTLLRSDEGFGAAVSGVVVLVLGALALPAMMRAVSPGVKAVGQGMSGVKATTVVAGTAAAVGAIAVVPAVLGAGGAAAGSTGSAGAVGAAGSGAGSAGAGAAGAGSGGPVGASGSGSGGGVGEALGVVQKGSQVGSSVQGAVSSGGSRDEGDEI